MRRINTSGFTLIELLVVLTIIGMLLTLAVPRYFHSVDKSKETILRENLTIMRDSIDKYYSDHNKYPDTLDDLVNKKYLRAIPPDPITQSTSTWVIVEPEDPDVGVVFDVKSGASGNDLEGIPYANL